jgi:alpha-galactosidase
MVPQVAPYYYGDYYPLTPYSRDEDHWLAWQFDRPEQGDGIVEAFRREKNGDASRLLRLSALDPSSRYLMTELDSGKSKIQSGSELMEHGLPVEIKEMPGAMVIRYARLR